MEGHKDAHKEGVIRVVKKKGGHGGHHGGAWKVAYADFVTSMMALFLVLWVTGQDEEVKQSIAGYFKDPIAFLKALNDSTASKAAAAEASGKELQESEKKEFEKIAESIKEALKEQPGLEHLQNQVEMELELDGMKIELKDTTSSFFFDVGTADLKPDAILILTMIADELGKLPNKVAIEGHTDSRQYSATNGYTNFELSADRANSARRILVENGVKAEQIIQITGYADSKLKNTEDPYNAVNRRISIKVRYTPQNPEADEKAKQGEGGEEVKSSESEKESSEKSSEDSEKESHSKSKH
jgi:chemotaxis protein MotB